MNDYPSEMFGVSVGKLTLGDIERFNVISLTYAAIANDDGLNASFELSCKKSGHNSDFHVLSIKHSVAAKEHGGEYSLQNQLYLAINVVPTPRFLSRLEELDNSKESTDFVVGMVEYFMTHATKSIIQPGVISFASVMSHCDLESDTNITLRRILSTDGAVEAAKYLRSTIILYKHGLDGHYGMIHRLLTTRGAGYCSRDTQFTISPSNDPLGILANTPDGWDGRNLIVRFHDHELSNYIDVMGL